MKTLLFESGLLFIGTNQGKVLGYVIDHTTTANFKLQWDDHAVFEFNDAVGFATLALCIGLNEANELQLFATFDNKSLCTWNVRTKEITATCMARKKITALTATTLTASGIKRLAVLASDKAGDIWAFNSSLTNRANVAGHTASIIADVLQLSNGSIATCDRDEKIRISQFPCLESIEGYCLGHSSVVTSIANMKISEDRELLLSCGWDRKLFVWNLDTKTPLIETDCSTADDKSRAVAVPVSSSETSELANEESADAAPAAAGAGTAQGGDDNDNDDVLEEKTYDESANGNFPIRILSLSRFPVFGVLFRGSTELQLTQVHVASNGATSSSSSSSSDEDNDHNIRLSDSLTIQLPRVAVDAVFVPLSESNNANAILVVLFDNDIELKTYQVSSGANWLGMPIIVEEVDNAWLQRSEHFKTFCTQHGVSYPAVSSFSVDGDGDPDKGLRKHTLDKPFNKETDITRLGRTKRSNKANKKRKADDLGGDELEN